MSCIKLNIRKNYLYPFLLCIFSFLRDIISFVLKDYCRIGGSLFLGILMFSGEILGGGLNLYCEKKAFKETKRNSLKKGNKKNKTKFMGIDIIDNKGHKMNPRDSKFKIYFLMVLSAILDLISFTTITFLTIEYLKKMSGTLQIRLRSMLIVTSSILCFLFLKEKITKHKILCLIITSICLVTITTTEYFCKEGETLRKVIWFTSILGVYLFKSAFHVIEKYLMEEDYIDPLKILLVEGGTGLIIMIIIILIIKFPLKNKLKSIINDESIIPSFKLDYKIIKNIVFIACLLFYLIFSIFRNIYRVITIKLFDPMSKALFVSLLDPLLVIYDLFIDDYIINKGKNKEGTINYKILYYSVNMACSVIMIFSSLIYNEIIVIYKFNLEENTFYEIRDRGVKETVNILNPADNIVDIDEEDEEYDDYDDEGKINETNRQSEVYD